MCADNLKWKALIRRSGFILNRSVVQGKLETTELRTARGGVATGGGVPVLNAAVADHSSNSLTDLRSRHDLCRLLES